MTSGPTQEGMPKACTAAGGCPVWEMSEGDNELMELMFPEWANSGRCLTEHDVASTAALTCSRQADLDSQVCCSLQALAPCSTPRCACALSVT